MKKHVKKWLKENAAWATAISDRYHVGLPDFMCILNDGGGKLTGIEVKSATGALTRRQEEEGRRMIAAGGGYWVARPNPDGDKKIHGRKLPAIIFTALEVPERGKP